jgi:hypothetical protein
MGKIPEQMEKVILMCDDDTNWWVKEQIKWGVYFRQNASGIWMSIGRILALLGNCIILICLGKTEFHLG